MKLTPREPTPEVAKLILDYGQACFECGAYNGNIPHEYQFLSDARALAHRLLVAKIGAMHDAAPSVPSVEQELLDSLANLCRRAINEANGLTNYVDERPELHSAEKRIAKIEQEFRAAIARAKGE